MAAYPVDQPLRPRRRSTWTPFPDVRRWHAAIAARPATQRAYALAKEVNPDAGQPLSEEERKHLFGHGARK